MITNTPENKTRFFALYWGQPVMRHDPSGHWGAKITAYTMKALSEGNYLELRPLSNITNEEAIEVAKIECRNYGTALEKIFPKGFSLRNQIGDKEYSGIYFDYVTDEGFTECPIRFYYPGTGLMIVSSYKVLSGQSFDYLRSRGFALPYMGVSVETLEEWGWVKLKGGAAE